MLDQDSYDRAQEVAWSPWSVSLEDLAEAFQVLDRAGRPPSQKGLSGVPIHFEYVNAEADLKAADRLAVILQARVTHDQGKYARRLVYATWALAGLR